MGHGGTRRKAKPEVGRFEAEETARGSSRMTRQRAIAAGDSGGEQWQASQRAPGRAGPRQSRLDAASFGELMEVTMAAQGQPDGAEAFC